MAGINIMNHLGEIECIFYDFDGVMTDNRVLVDQNGTESVFVNRGDGYAISQLKKLGINQVIVSTETNEVVKRRAEKLKIEVINGISDKGSVILKYCKTKGYDLKKTIFMGNDLNDITAMNVVGIKAAPADAEEEILAIADWIAQKKGGEGVIRELYRVINRYKK